MIAVIGTRGLPDVLGGVERHCEELYARLAARGFEILVFTRSPYVAGAPRWSTWNGVRLRKVWAPRGKGVEAFWHSFAAVALARAAGARTVHVHAVGPGLTVPLARRLGIRTVFTHHGRDYVRDKWGRVAKAVLRAGERAAVQHADQVVAVSREIAESVRGTFGREAVYAPNGVAVPARSAAQVDATLAGLGLRRGDYVVAVTRLVPEKGIHDLVEAVAGADDISMAVIVGEGGHRSTYAERLKAEAPAKVRFVGFQPHAVTVDLVRGARAFVLPSYHEGLPIALLEALACGTPAVASAIDPHREIITDGVHGWLAAPRDVAALRAAVREAWRIEAGDREALAVRGRALVAERFSWEQSADRVANVYRSLGE